MASEKLILIGCDDNFMLSALLSSIQDATVFPNHIISATRIADLIGIAGTLDPDMIITCFRDNQAALNDLHAAASKPGVPLLCLSRSFENERLQWPPASVVIPFQFDHPNRRRYLIPVINSLLHLRSAALQQVRPPISLADAARQDHQSDNSRNLSRYVMELDQKAEVLSKIKDRIAELFQQVDDSTRAELMSIVNAIKTSLHNNKLWEDFKMYFEQTDPNFLWKLAQKYPYLTAIDLKYCCYIKMNMSNDDIGNLLGINQESVRTHKYRLKKKMSLAREQDLRNYLRSVEPA